MESANNPTKEVVNKIQIANVPGYTIMKEITKTNTSRIFKAVRDENQEVVAIKISLSGDSKKDSIFKEYDILKRCEHSNIVFPQEIGDRCWISQNQNPMKNTSPDTFFAFMVTQF